MMKFDMGGSAAVLGAMRAIAELKPAGVEVHMVVASYENMVNGSWSIPATSSRPPTAPRLKSTTRMRKAG